MNSFTIKDLENLSGIKAHTIRIWEQRYDLIKPCRTCTNIRYYSDDELKKLLNIALLNKYGYKISHINKMDEQELKEKILTLTQCEAQQEKIINSLIECMIGLETEVLENTIDNYIAKKGIEKAAVQIIFPFLLKVNILWLTNQIVPAQEYLVSNIIRKKIILAIESTATPIKTNKAVLLFLPEGEHHELGLLFIHYLLKKHGVAVTYLGSNIPLSDVEYVANLKKPDYIYSHLTCVNPKFNFDKFISGVSQTFSKTKIIISGRLTQSYEKKIPAHIQFKKSFTEVMEFVETL